MRADKELNCCIYSCIVPEELRNRGTWCCCFSFSLWRLWMFSMCSRSDAVLKKTKKASKLCLNAVFVCCTVTIGGLCVFEQRLSVRVTIPPSDNDFDCELAVERRRRQRLKIQDAADCPRPPFCCDNRIIFQNDASDFERKKEKKSGDA